MDNKLKKSMERALQVISLYIYHYYQNEIRRMKFSVSVSRFKHISDLLKLKEIKTAWRVDRNEKEEEILNLLSDRPHINKKPLPGDHYASAYLEKIKENLSANGIVKFGSQEEARSISYKKIEKIFLSVEKEFPRIKTMSLNLEFPMPVFDLKENIESAKKNLGFVLSGEVSEIGFIGKQKSLSETMLFFGGEPNKVVEGVEAYENSVNDHPILIKLKDNSVSVIFERGNNNSLDLAEKVIDHFDRKTNSYCFQSKFLS